MLAAELGAASGSGPRTQGASKTPPRPRTPRCGRASRGHPRRTAVRAIEPALSQPRVPPWTLAVPTVPGKRGYD